MTPLKTENSTTEVFLNLGMKPKRSKTWDLKLHWLRDKEVLNKPRVYWGRGTNNDADYFTKRYLPIHHLQMRPRYIHNYNLVRTIPKTIILCKGVLERFPGNNYLFDFIKKI